MAQTLKLYQAPHALGQSEQEISLINLSGWHVVDPGWVPAVSDAGGNWEPPAVEEVLRIRSGFSSQDNLAAALVTLNKFRDEAAKYGQGDRQQREPVWLYDQLGSETSGRRAMVRNLRLKQMVEQHGVGTDEGSMISGKAVYELGIERMPWWERTTTVALPAAAPAAGILATYDYTATADIVGDAPGRLAYLSVSSGKTYNDPIGRLWIGIRSANKHGSGGLSNFVTIWELEDTGGTLGTDAARAADATASPGGGGNTKVTITPGTATWAKRLTITLGDVIAAVNYVDDCYGVFLWLLRAQVSAGTWEIQLRWGYESMPDADFVQGDIKQTTATSWDLIEMGVSEIPLVDLRCSGLISLGDNYNAVQVWARRTSGAGTLDLDCLVPVPIDEGFLKASGFSMQGDATHRKDWVFCEGPGGAVQFITYNVDSFSTEYIGDPDAMMNFRLPPGDGRMIIVYARSTSSDITDRLDAINVSSTGLYYPRWLALRGSE